MSITPSNQNIIALIKKDTILSMLERGVRIDGRKFNEYRHLEIIPGYAKKAEGSALVKLGDTQVLAGVKLEIGEPYPDTPDQGKLIVNAEFLPLAYETFEPGPPDENAIELSRVIDRSLRDSKAIDLSKLVIIPGKKVWTVWIDVYVLDYGGNVSDASMLAAVAALYDAKLPKVEIDNDKVKVVKEEKTTQFPIVKPVIITTIGKIGKYLIVDPNLDEENILDAKISIAYTVEGNIVGIQKEGTGTFTLQELDLVDNIGRSVYQRLIEELKKVIEKNSGSNINQGVSQNG